MIRNIPLDIKGMQFESMWFLIVFSEKNELVYVCASILINIPSICSVKLVCVKVDGWSLGSGDTLTFNVDPVSPNR